MIEKGMVVDHSPRKLRKIGLNHHEFSDLKSFGFKHIK